MPLAPPAGGTAGPECGVSTTSPSPPTETPPAAAGDPRATLAALCAGRLAGATRLDLRGCGLQALPQQVLALADTLQVLDVSGNSLSSLPEGVAGLHRLHTFFGSANRFTQLPPVLGRCAALDTLGFKANQIDSVPADALAPSLRWLILTDNRITTLPGSLVHCTRMQKLMLAGNRLTRLPAGLQALQRLELLRLAANHFARADAALPDALLALPRLAWLAVGGNPFNQAQEQAALHAAAAPSVPWQALTPGDLLGEGASGHIHAATWQPADGPARQVAWKRFKGAVTSDGLPESELAAMLAAGTHPHLLGMLAQVHGHPDGGVDLLLPRLPAQWRPLAGPPSMASCSRDVYPPGLRLPAATASTIARAVSAALAQLHQRGLVHGDLYGHNILVDGADGVLLSDFGAASLVPADDPWRADALRRIDRRALGVLHAELAQHCDVPATTNTLLAEAAALGCPA